MNDPRASAADEALASLDYGEVIRTIAGSATCEPGREAVLALRPAFGNQQAAASELALVDDTCGFLQSGGSLGFGGAIDARPLAERAALGASLSGFELRQVADTERMLRTAVARVHGDKHPPGPLHHNMTKRCRTDDVIAAIEDAVEEDGRVADRASAELSRIRRQQHNLHEQVRERCRAITQQPAFAKMLSEPIVTVRAGRYVVPVRSEFAGQFPGVVHDQSSSGATVFMEPLASVEANNALRGLEAAEQREVARVLLALSGHVGAQADALRSNASLLAHIDSLAARARWALTRSAGIPALDERTLLRIVHGRHPLLRREAVPLDFDIGESFDAVVISGPNMGGKTVVLKTVGLFCALAYAGVPLPAGAGTTIGGFTNIACIIGDEQSIAQDLSSFSAHLRALKAATEIADQRSLILVDEIGSGTEPAAGAALAQACIEAMITRGAKVVVTTHFTQLKTFGATHDRVSNASMLFDQVTHDPTYVYAQGIPGQSLAFALARTLALNSRLIERAETLLGVDARNLEQTFAKLAEDRERLHRLQGEIEEQQRRSQSQERTLRQRIAALEQEKEAFARRAAAELEKAVNDVRQTLVTRAEQRSQAAARQAAKPLPGSERLLADTLQDMRRSLGIDAPASGSAPARPLRAGDEVYVRSFDQNGVVSEVFSRDVLVTLGSLKTLVPTADVTLTGGASGNVTAAGSRERSAARPSASRRNHSVRRADDEETHSAVTSVDVRGMRVDEAWPLVDKALDDAALVGLSELRIVHGRGTGQLGRGIREFLDDHPHVASLSFAADRDGGTGVTVVKLA